MPLNVLLLGPQGAGKGTQAKRISAEYGIPHIASGEILRAEMDAGTELGKRVKETIERGDLVSDDLMIELIRNRLEQPDTEAGFVLDGFPRTTVQAEALDSMFADIGRNFNVAFALQIPDEVAFERLRLRADRRTRDDTDEAIKRRLDNYHRETEPLIEYYRTRGNLVPIHANRSENEVFAEISAGVGAGARVIVRKSAAEIEGMERAGQLVAATIALLGEHAQPGITTGELDRLAEDFIREHGGVPTSKGYRGFPAATCISPNAMVVHGIPGSAPGRGGRPHLRGCRGHPRRAGRGQRLHLRDRRGRPGGQRLLEVGQEALAAGIDQARAGNRVGDISNAVQRVVEGAGFSVVRSLVGHGVGRSYHEEPQIPNFGEPGRGPQLQPGMTLAIEPMITAGGPDVYLHDDEWSISTQDGSLAAHFEHTVAVAEEGPPRILTAAKSREKAGLVP